MINTSPRDTWHEVRLTYHRLSNFKRGGNEASLPSDHVVVNEVSFAQISV